MSYAPGAPPCIWALRVDPGTKLTLLCSWSRADHQDQQDPKPCTIWFPRRFYPADHPKAGKAMPPASARDLDVAERTGATPAAVRKHFTKLRALGLADASGRCVELTPPSQDCPHRGTDCDDRVNPSVASTATTGAETATLGAKTATTGAAHLNPPVPPTPPSPAVEAREPLPPPPKPRPAQASLVTGQPSAAQRSAQAQLERERAVVRAKFSGPPSDVLTAAMLEAVDPEHRDAWVQEAAGGEYGSWSTAMGERARKLGLTREALGVAVLASWERECAVFPRGIKPGQPDRGELWYGKHSTWLRKAAGLGESTAAETPRPGQFAMSGALRRVL